MDLDATSAITELDDPSTTPARRLEVLHQVAALTQDPNDERPPARVVLQIDLTDPPSPVLAIMGELVVEGATADDAVMKLGQQAAVGLRELALEQTSAELDALPVVATVTKGG